MPDRGVGAQVELFAILLVARVELMRCVAVVIVDDDFMVVRQRAAEVEVRVLQVGLGDPGRCLDQVVEVLTVAIAALPPTMS